MKRKRVLSIALCVLLLASMLPMPARAEDSFTVDGLSYSVNNDATSVTLTGVDETRSGEIAVPASVMNGENTYAVTKIGANAFYQKTGITGVTLPESVTSIGERAFAESGLTSFTFPDSVTEVPNYCFSDCASLSSVTLADDTTTIGIEAFARTPALTELELPAALMFIRMNAFLPQNREQRILTLHYMGTSRNWANVTQYTDAEDIGSIQPADAASLFVAAIVCHDAHDFSNGGICTCGKSVAASITLADGSTTTYYDTLSAALAAVSTASAEYSYDGSTVTLLRSVSEAGLTLSGSEVNCTLDLGGCTLTDPNSTGLSIHTGAAVTIRNGTVTANNSGGVKASSGAQVTLSGVTSPTIELNDADTVVTVGSGVSVTSHMRMHGGTMQLNAAPGIAGFTDGAQFVFKDGVVQTNVDLGSTVYKVCGGSDATYPLPFARGGDGIALDPQSFTSAAEGYYVGRNADGGLSLFEGSCSHAETDNDGHCDVCGVPFAAKVTVGTANPVYYTKMSTALSQWSQQTEQTTLTLLHDGEYDSTGALKLSGNHILDLNGCTLTMKGQGDIQLNTGAELCMQDSSSAQDGRYKGRITLVGDNTSFTLDSGHIDYSENAVMVSDNNEKSRQITVNGGSITSSKHCIDGGGRYAKIQINGGTLSSTGGSSAIRFGIVTLKEAATVFMASSDANAIAVYRLAIEGTPNIRGRLCYSSDTELVDLSGYTGDGLEIRFDLTDGVYQKGDESIKLPENYGLFKNGEEITEIARGVAKVELIHVHSWSFSAEGAVITATCGGSGTCPVENGTATITLVAPGPNPVYNGYPQGCTVEQSVPDLFPDVDKSSIIYPNNEYPQEVGAYTASLTYNGAEAKVSFTIAPIDISGKSMDAIPACVYTGSAITPAVNVPGLTAGTDYDVTYSGNTNAGTATVTASGKGHYAGTITGSFTIQPADIVIAAQLGKDAYDYTGSVVEPEVSVTTTFNGVTVNLAKDMDYSVIYGQDTAAGSIVPVTISPAANGNFRFEPVTLHYSIGKAVPVYTTPSFTATYGQTLGALALPTAENGVWSWNEGNGTPVGAVGSRSHKATFTPSDGVNYKSVTLDVAVEVAPAVLTVTGVNIASRAYNGSDQVAVSSLAIKGRVGTDDVTVRDLSTLKGTAPSANAGTYSEVTLPNLYLTGAAAANYTLTQPGKIAASYTIQPKTVYPTVEVAAGTYRYTGAAQTPAVTVKDGSSVIPAGEYSAVYDCNVNAGTGRVYISDVSGGNYAFNPVQGTFTIQQAVITITAEDKTASTGQKAPSLTYKVSGLAAGEKLGKEPTVSYVTKPDMSKAGTTVIRAGGAAAPSANYTISYVDGKLTVTKSASTGGSTGGSGGYYGNVAVTVDMSGIQLKHKTYDGKPISFTGEASGRYYYGDFTYTWYTASGYKLSEAPTDVGDYTLRATVSRSGYSGYASKNVSIRKAQLTVVADDLSADVGGEAPKLSYSVTGLAVGDKLKTEPQLSYETEPDMAKAGKTPILVSGAAVPDTKNYEQTIQYIEGTLTVSEPGGDAEADKNATEAETPEEGEADGGLLKVVVREGIREENISDEIKAGGFDSAERVEAELKSRVRKLDKSIGRKNVAFYDVQLQQSSDGGASWQTVGAETLADDGTLPVSLPLPEGSHENCRFRVVRMQSGKAAGAVEEVNASVTRHEDGKWYLEFDLSEPSPVAVGWVDSVKSGFPWWILPVGGVTLAGLIGIPLLLRRRRDDGDEEI